MQKVKVRRRTALAGGLGSAMFPGLWSSAVAASFVPKGGFVPDEETAVAIAEAILVPIMGRRAMQEERPYRAILKGNEWTVFGYLGPEYAGGVAIVKMDKKSGTILHFSHGQ